MMIMMMMMVVIVMTMMIMMMRRRRKRRIMMNEDAFDRKMCMVTTRALNGANQIFCCRWGLMTITTVGYDLNPRTLLGLQ